MSSLVEITPKQEYAQRVAKFRDQMESQAAEVRAALPVHVPLEKFNRVLQTAVTSDPKLLYADRASLWLSAMKCAQDGLLPDGRDAALVRFWDSKLKVEKVQYFPMTFGILKKVRNSGEVKSVVARVVYAGDQYRYWIDETGEHLLYEQSPTHDINTVVCVFAMAKTKDDELMVEPLSPAEIEKIRQVSRAKDKGPWVDWWEEMAKKSAIRRLAKRLPMNTDLDDLVRRDDALYDFEGRSDKAIAASGSQPKGLTARLEALAAPRPAHDLETGEITEQAGDGDAPADEATANGRLVSPQGVQDDGEASGDADAAPSSTASEGDLWDDLDPASPEGVLIAKLKIKAGRGAKALRLAMTGLTKDEEGLLTNADHDALGAIADAVKEDDSFPGDRA